MNTTDLENRHYRLTEDTEQNIRAAEMMSKLIGLPLLYPVREVLKRPDAPSLLPFLTVTLVTNRLSLVEHTINSTEISYSELEGLYKEQYWFDASVEDAKYEDGKNAEESNNEN